MDGPPRDARGDIRGAIRALRQSADGRGGARHYRLAPPVQTLNPALYTLKTKTLNRAPYGSTLWIMSRKP